MQMQCGACSGLIEVPQGQEGQSFACPLCGAVVVTLAPVAAAQTGQAGARAPVTGDTKSCPQCGEAIQASAVKCRHCGEWLDAARRAAVKGAEALLPKFQKGMKGLGWGLIVFGVLYLVGGGGMLSIAGARAPLIALGLVLVGVLTITVGILLLVRMVWANYISLVLFIIVGIGGLINIVSIGGGGVIFVGLLIPLVAVINSSSNLSQYRKILAAGLDPWQKAEKK